MLLVVPSNPDSKSETTLCISEIGLGHSETDENHSGDSHKASRLIFSSSVSSSWRTQKVFLYRIRYLALLEDDLQVECLCSEFVVSVTENKHLTIKTIVRFGPD